MHDYFEIVGVAPGAAIAEVRLAGRRRLRALHPDFQDTDSGDLPVQFRRSAPVTSKELGDAAVDFVDMGAIVDRMQAAFFGPHASAR